mgnify:CR=1 FL=1
MDELVSLCDLKLIEHRQKSIIIEIRVADKFKFLVNNEEHGSQYHQEYQ